jgi:hypothetical protein
MVITAISPTPPLPRPATDPESWPAIPFDAWRDTHATLHMWLQIVGKVRLALMPRVNHWWSAALYLSARGVTTGPMPVPASDRQLEITFDFLEHNLDLQTSDGQRKILPLLPRAVADFYREFLAALQMLKVPVRIWPHPVEIANPIPFDQDEQHASYDPLYVRRFWQILQHTQDIFAEFRGRFLGKCSPVHLFWGSCDLAVTRFNGRRVPERPEADAVTREAYSHECISHGFWPGGSWFGAQVPNPIYYSYTVPEPAGLREASLRPNGAHFDAQLGEFILPYDQVRQARSPVQCLLEFLQSTYEAGADRGGWDRAALDRTEIF